MKFGIHEPNLPIIPGALNEQYRFKFANGFGASVVRGPYTYGGPEGLFEVAVLGQDGHLNYETPITNDVLGYLSESEVTETLDAIAALPTPSEVTA